jgi:hypothetical protein
LQEFRREVMWLWRKWLGRRNRLGPLSWPFFRQFLERFPLPQARVTDGENDGAKPKNLQL